MIKKLDLSLSPKEAALPELFRQVVFKAAGWPESCNEPFSVVRRTIDARSRKGVKVLIQVALGTPEDLPEPFTFLGQNVSGRPPVLVVGAGPAGLFAALHLIELGLRPIVLERGKEVSARKKDIAALSRGKGLNSESNYCFGEGGAGAFSDGKLYSRSRKKGDYERILKMFHYFGAPDEVLCDAHPHIGSDKLPGIIKKMRLQILECGGEVRFDTRVSSLVIQGGFIKGVETAAGEVLESRAVVLATGHSASDVYQMLHRQGVALENKPFALGVRVEHPQEFIDGIQYHRDPEMAYLPAASYALATQTEGRGVFSFCMCPGGFIICSSSSSGGLVVNGMSSAARHTPFANSGVVVEVRPQDVVGYDAPEALRGLAFQQEVERLAAVNGGGFQRAPAQCLSDFVEGRMSASLPPCSYLPEVVISPIHFWLPDFISTALREGFKEFSKKMHGYVTNDALVVGVESRSSSPVRIPRDPDTLQHIQIKGLFPCGEGAGYAGGITSSAMDGERCAEAVAKFLDS